MVKGGAPNRPKGKKQEGGGNVMNAHYTGYLGMVEGENGKQAVSVWKDTWVASIGIGKKEKIAHGRWGSRGT